jgi:hypothetical protein
MASTPIDTVPPADGPGTGRRGGPTDPSHDEELRRGILHTAISRPLALAMAGSFVVFIFALPVAQAVLEHVREEPSMLLDVFTRPPTKESFLQYEEDLEKASYPKAYVQPRMQLSLTRLRVGNKKAVIGHDRRWLYYAPGVQYVAGPGFLDEDVQKTRIKVALDGGEEEVHPDPRPAILDFHRALAARGIRLVLFPVPDKVSLAPVELHGRRPPGGDIPVAGNRDFPRLVADLRAAGVLVFDAAPEAIDPRDRPRFLQQDTHWAPEWMELVARDLADLLKQHGGLPAREPPTVAVVPQPMSRVGDIVDMLKLPEDQRLFVPQTVTVNQVRAAGGEVWQPRDSADVLLLGDSFTNIYTLGQMGWGEGAGLAPQLSRALGRDLDVIAQNDSGAFATRKLLSEALGAGEDRLAGKKIVIWQFAARELAVGDWRPLPYRLGKAGP